MILRLGRGDTPPPEVVVLPRIHSMYCTLHCPQHIGSTSGTGLEEINPSTPDGVPEGSFPYYYFIIPVDHYRLAADSIPRNTSSYAETCQVSGCSLDSMLPLGRSVGSAFIIAAKAEPR